MIGRRLPDAHICHFPTPAPGEYVKCIYPDGPEWGFLAGTVDWLVTAPNGHGGSIRGHTITEHEDGTITASPSLLIRDSNGRELWHGYLEHGVWRSC